MIASGLSVLLALLPFSTVYVGGSKTNATAIRFLSSSRTFGRWRLVLARRRCWNWSSSCADMVFFWEGVEHVGVYEKTVIVFVFVLSELILIWFWCDLVSYWAAYEGIRKIVLWALGRVFKVFAKCRRVVSRLRAGQQAYQHSCLRHLHDLWKFTRPCSSSMSSKDWQSRVINFRSYIDWILRLLLQKPRFGRVLPSLFLRLGTISRVVRFRILLWTNNHLHN